MKKINKILAVALASVALVGCNELDTVYEGYYVTNDQKGDVLAQKPEMALASVTGISAIVNQYGATVGTHMDFGYAAMMLAMDSQGTDMVARNVGYNWFNTAQALTGFQQDGSFPYMFWNLMYSQIFASNAVLSSIPADTDNDELKFYRAQAYGYRAFDYWVLIQNFARTYNGNADKPGVILITEENAEEVAANGAVRSTVEEVYTQILSDLNEAIRLIEESGVSASQVIDSKPHRMLNADALYGLRARAYLTMHEYAKAAQDAKKAIEVSSCTPYSIAEVSKPTFTSLDDHSWMWGIAVAETDRVVTSGIVNFPSHTCSFAYGYVTVGAWRATNAVLFNSIPDTDVRKGWFLDGNNTSVNLTAQQQAYLDSYGYGSPNDEGTSLISYTNVKFDSYQSVLYQNVNSSDIPLMRIEEMYYILAEGLAMSGNTGEALSVLTSFEQTYRNPGFSTRATSAEEIQEVIWNKRRVEFWGEGLSWFDIKRLDKGIDRRGLGFATAFVYNVAPDSQLADAWIYPMPEEEITSNKMLTSEDNNKNLDRPEVIVE